MTVSRVVLTARPMLRRPMLSVNRKDNQTVHDDGGTHEPIIEDGKGAGGR